MSIKKTIYKKWDLYVSDGLDKNIKLGMAIVNSDFKVQRVIKDSERNYVAIVIIKNKKYILKEIRAEVKLIQRRFQTIFKKGEALTTLINYYDLDDSLKKHIAEPYVVLIQRNILINKSYILSEYIEGTMVKTVEDIDAILYLIKELHEANRYHGDLNTSNFLKSSNGKIVTFDTQLKKELFLNFKRSYDILNLKEDLLVLKLGYDVEKRVKINKFNIGFIIAFIIKQLKKTRLINIIRNQKKKIRKKRYEYKKRK